MCDDKAKQFDNFFIQNYKLLMTFSKRLDNNDYENLLHDVYLRCRDRVSREYEGQEFLNFVRVSLMNYNKTIQKQKKKMQLVDINDQNYLPNIDQKLLQYEDFQEQENERQDNLSYIIANLYEYLEVYHNKRDVLIFKSYYLLKRKHLNYKELSDATGYSQGTVSTVIKKLKKSIRENLMIYCKIGIDMGTLLQEVEILLQKDINAWWGEYKNMYLKITGTVWNGCKCKSGKLKTEIQNWYNLNKTK